MTLRSVPSSQVTVLTRSSGDGARTSDGRIWDTRGILRITDGSAVFTCKLSVVRRDSNVSMVGATCTEFAMEPSCVTKRRTNFGSSTCASSPAHSPEKRNWMTEKSLSKDRCDPQNLDKQSMYSLWVSMESFVRVQLSMDFSCINLDKPAM